MSVRRFGKSLKDAISGLISAYKSEQNLRIQVIAAIIVIIAAAYFPLKAWESLLVILMVFFVLVMELLNTALEKFIDLLKPRLHYYAKVVKDIMAAAVFLTSLCALIVGTVIFLPYLINLINAL